MLASVVLSVHLWPFFAYLSTLASEPMLMVAMEVGIR